MYKGKDIETPLSWTLKSSKNQSIKIGALYEMVAMLFGYDKTTDRAELTKIIKTYFGLNIHRGTGKNISKEYAAIKEIIEYIE
ncbi:MAG: hypothetical protein SNI70_10475 [Rikenellaceae bacterium]